MWPGLFNLWTVQTSHDQSTQESLFMWSMWKKIFSAQYFDQAQIELSHKFPKEMHGLWISFNDKTTVYSACQHRAFQFFSGKENIVINLIRIEQYF